MPINNNNSYSPLSSWIGQWNSFFVKKEKEEIKKIITKTNLEPKCREKIEHIQRLLAQYYHQVNTLMQNNNLSETDLLKINDLLDGFRDIDDQLKTINSKEDLLQKFNYALDFSENTHTVLTKSKFNNSVVKSDLQRIIKQFIKNMRNDTKELSSSSNKSSNCPMM